MKIRRLLDKIIWISLLGLGVLGGTCDPVYAQKIVFPSNVVYVAGGYINKRPYYSTLEAALNQVKPYATALNPYVLWIDGDTTRIADWDSVFTESGLTMKDSIEIYYITTGKIKWGPIALGGTGTGGGSATLYLPNDNTSHYNYPKWTYGSYPAWYDSMSRARDSIDQHIYDLIVYTDSAFLVIENDTLRLDIDNLVDTLVTLGITGWNPYPDTTYVVRRNYNSTMAAVYTLTGSVLTSGNGFIQIGTFASTTARVLYGSNSLLMYSNAGAGADTVAMRSWVNTNYRANTTLIGWTGLTTAVRDSINDEKSYIQLYFQGSKVITIATANQKYIMNACTTGVKRNISNTDSSVTITVSGVYEIMVTTTVSLSNTTTDIHGHIFINDVEKTRIGSEVNVSGASDLVQLTSQGILELVANDIVELKFFRTAGSSTDVTVTHFSLSVMKID